MFSIYNFYSSSNTGIIVKENSIGASSIYFP